MNPSLSRVSTPRWGWVLVPAALAVLVRLGAGTTSAREPGQLLEALALEAECSEVSGVVWEASRGPLFDAVLGRRLLFLGRPAGDDLPDVFRARARTTPEGAIVAVEAVSNLTKTPLGDERQLQSDGRYAAFSSFSEGIQQGVTVLDLAGKPPPGNSQGSWLARRLEGFRKAALERVARYDFQLPAGATHRLSVASGQVTVVDAEGHTLARPLAELPTRGELLGVQFSAQSPSGTTAVQGVVDLLRGWLGPLPVAWMELRAFKFVDDLRKPPRAASALPAKPVRVAAEATVPAWPPPDLAPLLEGAPEGEGRWSKPALPEPDPVREELFRQTSLRVDSERPYAVLHLVALDMRHLELRMEAGYEEPRPKTGPPGAGALPRDVATLRRVVATFNGGFKSVHGDYGMMVDGRLLVPPTAGAATVVTTADGRAGMGPWPETKSAIPPDLVSFRQNLEPLVSHGLVNPSGRTFWGQQLVGEPVATLRSALCLTRAGQLYFAMGQELTGESLARGLVHAQCEFAMHLDMNPGHVGFFYHAISGPERENVKSSSAVSRPTMPPDRHLYWSPKDFFYLLLRQPQPNGDGRWLVSPGLQPSPERVPAIFDSKRSHGELSVTLTRVDAGRLAFHVLAGDEEPLVAGRPAPRRALEGDATPLFALGTGVTTVRQRLGLAFQSDATLPMRSDVATVLVRGGELRILPPGAPVTVAEQEAAVQLPALVIDGVLTARATSTGERRQRGALCVLPDGAVVVATALHDSPDVLALQLLEEQCSSIVELDRGSKHPASVWRAGTSPGGNLAAVTRLVGTARPMRPHTFSWQSPRE